MRTYILTARLPWLIKLYVETQDHYSSIFKSIISILKKLFDIRCIPSEILDITFAL